MSEEKRKAIASKRGKTAHAKGRAHKFTREENAQAGRLAHELGRAHTWTVEEAREAGRKGAAARERKRLKRREAASSEEV